MKLNILYAIMLCFLTHGCIDNNFKKIKGNNAPYSIVIPKDFVSNLDDPQIKRKNINTDLNYTNFQGGTIRTGIIEIMPDDSTSSLKQFANLSDLECLRMMRSKNMQNLQLLDRKLIVVNGVDAYFFAFRSDRINYQLLYQQRKNLLFTIMCTYSVRNDSLKDYYYKILTSVVWDDH